MIAPSPSDGSRHLMLPSQLPEVAQYEALRSLLERRLDMQIKDLRVLLLLPIKELDLDAGCNFAAAAVLFNLLAGVSVCFMDADPALLDQRANRGAWFKDLLNRYYPRESEELEQPEGVELLYD